MRLRKDIAVFIKSELKKIEPHSEVYLFGSRADDKTKGGDIDILWLTNKKVSNYIIRKFKIGFYKKFGWQKIDIVNFTFREDDVFKRVAMQNAVEL
jgi:predicted nucleotidyltransferase